MIKRIWYLLVYAYVFIGLRFYFNKIVVRGKEYIPSTGPVLFFANHQNALLDALLVATTHSRLMHFLARADLFKKPLLRWLLSTLNMKPVFRIRDGWSTLQGNQQSFSYCREVILNNETLLLFPEGNHDLRRRLRPLSKGFTRIVYDVLSRDPDSMLVIIPVGLNYENHQAYKTSVSVYYGEPILAKNFISPDFQESAAVLKKEVSNQLKKLITHIESTEEYDSIIQQLDKVTPNYLDPIETNNKLQNLSEQPQPSQPSLKLNWFLPFHIASFLINLPPLVIWNFIKSKIKDPVFIATARFGVGITAYPVYYISVTAFIFVLTGSTLASICLAVFLISMPVYGLTKGA
jgi:1-acyl-sn-glycerol-3-phosphate acyltransferase